MYERDVYNGRNVGGLSISSCASSSPDSEPSDSSSANKSFPSSSLFSTDAGPLDSGDCGFVMRNGETAERECWCAVCLQVSSKDLSVGRLGVDFD